MKRGGDGHESSRRRAGRQRIAVEAARLMATKGLQDSREAARQAARELGERDARALPEHGEVIEQLREYQRLFRRDTQPAALQRRRQAALEALSFFAAFEPRLVGPVLDGSADDDTPVSLQVFAEDPDAFARFLLEHGLPYTASSERVRIHREEISIFTGWRFLADGLPFEVVALPPSLLRQAPLGPDGKPMARASAAALRALLR